jgi:hypothetical protein
MKYINPIVITALATALIASFGFSSYQHFFIIAELQDEKKEIKRSSDSVILVITERPTYSSSVETTNEIKAKKGGEVYLGQENKANQENKLRNENKNNPTKK